MPGTRCIVEGCNNSLVETLCSDNEDVQRTQYYEFPDNPEIREKWLQFVGKEDYNPDVSYVCSAHFMPEDYDDVEEERVLKDTAVPSLMYLEIKSHHMMEFSEESEDPSSIFQSQDEESHAEGVKHDVHKNEIIFFDKETIQYENSDHDDESQGHKTSQREKSNEQKFIACELCGRGFSRKVALEHHLSRIHKLSESKILYYLEKVTCLTSRNYKCKVCKRMFYKQSKLDCHKCDPPVAVVCEICQHQFFSKTGLKTHLLSGHGLGKEKVDSIMEELVDYDSRFYRKFKVTEDIVIEASDGRVISKHGDSRFKTTGITGGIKCPTCYKFVKDETSLAMHVCQLIIEVLCKNCQYKAPTKYNFRRHLLLRHKLPEHDIKAAVKQFDRYNEKWQLRIYDPLSQPKQKRKRLSRRRVTNDFSVSIVQSLKEKSGLDFYAEENAVSDSDGQNIFAPSSEISKSKTKKTATKSVVCEICQAEFPLRIALKRHLDRDHDLDPDVIHMFLERTLCGEKDNSDNKSIDVSSDSESEESIVETSDQVDLISNTISPIDCEICLEKLESKKDLRGHLLQCFQMDESTVDSIFKESKDYYAKFYGSQNTNYNIVLSSTDGRMLCKKANSPFVPVPGPRCVKCNKAFEDEFKIVDHECAPTIKITCRLCERFSSPSSFKVTRHLVNVHNRDKDDVKAVLEEFKGYNTRMQLRKYNWCLDRPIKTEKIQRETLQVRVKDGISSDYFVKVEEDSSSPESETTQLHKKKKLSETFKEEVMDHPLDSEEILNEVIKEEKRLLSEDEDNLNSFRSGDFEPPVEDRIDLEDVSACESDQKLRDIVCEICKRKFCRKITLKAHLSHMHHLTSSQIDYYLTKILRESAANFKCSTCKKQFYKESRLASHNCSPAIAVVCELCQCKVTSKKSLRKHLQFTHNMEESKVNSILAELSGFNSKFYKKHLIEGDEIAIYSSDGRKILKKDGCRYRKYMGPKCDRCYKPYTEEEPESNHQCATKIELGCEICKYKAPSKYNLRRHLMLIHKITQNEAKLAMDEFCRYNEKMELRDISTT